MTRRQQHGAVTDRGAQGIPRGGGEGEKGDANCPAKSFGIQPNGSIDRFYSCVPSCRVFQQEAKVLSFRRLTTKFWTPSIARYVTDITDKSLSQTVGGHDFNLEIIPRIGDRNKEHQTSSRHFH